MVSSEPCGSPSPPAQQGRDKGLSLSECPGEAAHALSWRHRRHLCSRLLGLTPHAHLRCPLTVSSRSCHPLPQRRRLGGPAAPSAPASREALPTGRVRECVLLSETPCLRFARSSMPHCLPSSPSLLNVARHVRARLSTNCDHNFFSNKHTHTFSTADSVGP